MTFTKIAIASCFVVALGGYAAADEVRIDAGHNDAVVHGDDWHPHHDRVIHHDEDWYWHHHHRHHDDDHHEHVDITVGR